MKVKRLNLALLAICALAPCKVSAIPMLTWLDTTDVILPATATGFDVINYNYAPAPGDPREQAGFSGTSFSTVDVSPFSFANVWMVESSGSTTLSDWIGIDSLTRVANGNGWDYTIALSFASNRTDEGQGNIPNPPSSPPWNTYPFVTEDGTIQDITGAFRINGPFPGYTAPAGLTSLLTIRVASDVETVPDTGSTLMLIGFALAAVGLVKHRFSPRPV